MLWISKLIQFVNRLMPLIYRKMKFMNEKQNCPVLSSVFWIVFEIASLEPQREAASGRLHKGGAACGRHRPPLWNPWWLCRYVAMWLCGYVAMYLCGYVAMWLCGYVAVFQSFKNSKFQNFKNPKFRSAMTSNVQSFKVGQVQRFINK